MRDIVMVRHLFKAGGDEGGCVPVRRAACGMPFIPLYGAECLGMGTGWTSKVEDPTCGYGGRVVYYLRKDGENGIRDENERRKRKMGGWVDSTPCLLQGLSADLIPLIAASN